MHLELQKNDDLVRKKTLASHSSSVRNGTQMLFTFSFKRRIQVFLLNVDFYQTPPGPNSIRKIEISFIFVN